MFSTEREKEILDLLSQNKYATVEYLAQKIHISPSSIRRDLKRLELNGKITRSYGGAELKNSINKQIPFYMRSHKNTKEKACVAKKAATLVKQGDTIFLDSSTSTYFMIEHLCTIKDITVVTNSLANFSALSEYNMNVYLAGGRLNPENRSCFIGAHTEDIINSVHADYCFFSVQSLISGGVLYDCFANEIVPRKLMIQNSEKSVFLCDGSKIDHFSAYKLCHVSNLDYIISDINIENYLDDKYTNLSFI